MGGELGTDLVMYTLYHRPADHPLIPIVIRVYTVTRNGEVTLARWYAGSLAAARLMLPPGLHCLGRQPDDDPVIVETWV